MIMFPKIKGSLHIHKDNIPPERRTGYKQKNNLQLLTHLPSPHPKKDRDYSPALTSTASESCQKRHRIQNHMVALKNSAWIAWDRVSCGNCLYRGSMCAPPPALHDKTDVWSSLLCLRAHLKLYELQPETKPFFLSSNTKKARMIMVP